MENEPGLADPSTKLILVVDDDPNIVDLLQASLSAQGFQIEIAGDGAEAVAKFRKRTPDLVLTDLMMPKSGGFDLIRDLKQNEDSTVPVIVFTARTLDSSTEHLIRSEPNVVAHERKPLRIDSLIAKLHQFLKTQPRPHGRR